MENWYLVLQGYPMPNLAIPCPDPSGCGLAHAHNFYLQTWAEQGILGFVSVVAIVAVGFRLGGGYLRSTNGFQRALVFGTLWSFASLAIHSLVDSGPSTPGAIALWAMLGLMVAAGQREGVFSRDATGCQRFLGVGEWLLMCCVLIVASVAAIGTELLLGLLAAIAAGVALARASLACGTSQAPARDAGAGYAEYSSR
jgi:hypothetical protein